MFRSDHYNQCALCRRIKDSTCTRPCKTNWILQSLFSDLSSPFKKKVRKSFIFWGSFSSWESIHWESNNSIGSLNRSLFSSFVCFLWEFMIFAFWISSQMSNEYFSHPISFSFYLLSLHPPKSSPITSWITSWSR